MLIETTEWGVNLIRRKLLRLEVNHNGVVILPENLFGHLVAKSLLFVIFKSNRPATSNGFRAVGAHNDAISE